jgi:flagellar basal body P-ring protein FlgI
MAGEQIVLLHKMLKNSKLSDAECEKNIADIICKAPLPACSSDRSKLVHVQSMQDCNKNAEW